MLKGVDVSRYQGQINWDLLKSEVDFAIIKASGGDDGLYQDGLFSRNKSEARRVGILHGFYHFAGGVHSPEEEADHFINTIGGLEQGEIIVLDFEIHIGNAVDFCKRFLDHCKARTGFPPMIYMNASTVNGYDWTPVVAGDYGLWIASWGNNDTTPDADPGHGKWPFWALWQYSSTGSLSAIPARVDLDQFNGDHDAWMKYGPGNLAPAPAPTPPPAPPAPAPSGGKYTVKAGDTLSSIGAAYGTNWQTIYAMNQDQLTNPNRIYPGQVLNVPGGGSAPQTQNYTVKSGDTLSSIGAQFGTPWQQIYAWNQAVIGPNPNMIKPGQVLRVK